MKPSTIGARIFVLVVVVLCGFAAYRMYVASESSKKWDASLTSQDRAYIDAMDHVLRTAAVGDLIKFKDGAVIAITRPYQEMGGPAVQSPDDLKHHNSPLFGELQDPIRKNWMLWNMAAVYSPNDPEYSKAANQFFVRLP